MANELTAQEQQQIRQAFAEALTSSGGGAGGHAEAMAGGGAKDIFCKDWQTAKQVLQFLQQFAPAWLKPIIAILIAVGDRVFGTICKA